MALTKVKGSVADPIYLNEDENLADLPDKVKARTNLDVPQEAPKDGKSYTRKNGQWIEMVQSIQLPVGAIISWPGKSAPAGWLAIEPVTIYQRTDYPALYKHFQDECPHLIIDADTFKLAEGRGAFFRGYDPTGVNDPDGVGRELLTAQGDASRKITGQFANRSHTSSKFGRFQSASGAFSLTGSGSVGDLSGTASASGVINTFDSSRVVPTAAENRPKNLNALWIIKAYDTIADPELLQAKAVIDQVNANSSRIGVLEQTNDYALIDLGTASNNTRYVKPNPFGNNTPVICEAEVLINAKWANPNFIYSYNGDTSYGVVASYVKGEGIIAQTGKAAVKSASFNSGGGHGLSGSTVSAPCRVHVWRVGV